MKGTPKQPGTIVADKYRLEERLGSGGFGEVWLATEVSSSRRVAVKFLFSVTADATRRFGIEAQALSRLDHPNCVTLFDYGISAGEPYLVTEHLAGSTLHEWSRTNPRSELAIDVGRQIAAGLIHAHRRQLLHRDLKPTNIFISYDTHGGICAHIIDFGIAKLAGAEFADVTKTGEIIGTPGYMSPEQLRAQPNIGPACDVYALGVVLFELLEGAPPFPAETQLDVAMKHLIDPPPPLSHGDENVRALVGAMLAKQPEDRPTMAVVERTLSGQPFRSTPKPAPKPPREDRNEEPMPSIDSRLVWWLGVALVVLAAVLVVALHEDRSEPVATARVDDRRAAKLLRTAHVSDEKTQEPGEDMARDALRDVAVENDDPEPNTGDRARGCGREVRTGSFSLSVRVNRGLVNVRIPPGYSPERPAPVVLVLHDATQPSEDMVQITRLNALSDEANYVLVAPGDPDIQRTWMGFGVLEHGMAALREAADHVCIDLNKVFLIGHGNGAYAAKEVACHVDGVVAMALTSHRLFEQPPCERDPVPTLFIASTEDPAMPIQGGRDCLGSDLKWSLADHEADLARRHRCDASRRTTKNLDHGRCIDMGCDVRLRTCRVSGGRDWETMPRRIGVSSTLSPCYSVPIKFDVEGEIWRFFTEEMKRTQDGLQ